MIIVGNWKSVGRQTCCKNLFLTVVSAVFLASCAIIPAIDTPKEDAPQLVVSSQEEKETVKTNTVTSYEDVMFSETPQAPTTAFEYDDEGDDIERRLEGGEIVVNFNNLPVPSFINEVFGNILRLSFEIDASLKKRPDLVTLRAVDPQSHRELYRISRMVLANYGIGVELQGDVLHFYSFEDPDRSEPPLIVSGRALPGVPTSHRPIIQIVPLKVVSNSGIAGWLKNTFKNMNLLVYEDPLRNALILQGPARMVKQAMKAIDLLDRPTMRGSHSVRISPSFLDAETLADMLTKVLISEGYGATKIPPLGAVIVLPIRQTNAVVVFAADRQVLEHVKSWASELDKPGNQNASSGLFYYQVRNTSAEDLAAVLGGIQEGDAVPKILIDKNRNGLIFTGDSKKWEGILSIITAMDRPARLVNVEVTIASVTLTDDTELGVNWLFRGAKGRFDELGQTNFGIGGNGFSYMLNNAGQALFALNALAQDQRVTILSKPSILVKSGNQATIDVGEEIPIITSQSQSTDT